MTHNLAVVLLKFFELEILGPYDLVKVWSKLLQTQRAVGSIIFHTVIAFMGCTIIGSLVNAIVQIVFFEVMAEIVIAITAISVAILINPATVVIAAIIVVVSAVVVPNVATVVLPTAVVIPTTIMTTVSALTVV